MKHISIRRIGKKLIALSMAAVASVTMMLAAAPTASAVNTAEYTPDDAFITLPAPLYNWRNSNKILKFKVKRASGGSGTVQDAMRLLDKSGYYRTNFESYVFTGSGVATTRYGATMAPIMYSGGWYEYSIPVKQLGTFAYPVNTDEYLPTSQTKLQTLVTLENRGFYYKDFEIVETVDPDRNVSRFYTNAISENVWNKYDLSGGKDYGGADAVRYWHYTNKKIVFDFRATNAHYYGDDIVKLTLTTTNKGTTWKRVARPVNINVVTGECELNGSTVTNLGSGWYHIEIPLKKCIADDTYISNPEAKTLDVVGFDWVNKSFEMRNFKVA